MNIKWDAGRYGADFSFVPKYGEGVLDLLDAPTGSYVIDLGCGTGDLTEKLSEKGYRVTGFDPSIEMLSEARRRHPGLDFREGGAEDFTPDAPADAVFSNAVMHWIDAGRQQAALNHIASQIKAGGSFVCEFGGALCAESVHSALEKRFSAHGLRYRRTFFFPTIGEYAPLLERAGLRVEYATLFDRPTVQGPDGVAGWIRMFDTAPFEGVPKELSGRIIAEAEDALRPVLFRNGVWYVDYVRIRFKARKL